MPSIKSKIMKKLNGFESYLVINGLNKVCEEMKADIIAYENSGKVPLMTTSYVDMIITDAIKKIELLTLKQK
jgi:hypothetical protein